MAVTAEQFAWMDRAACLGLSVGIFYPRQGGDIETPLRICAECPVLTECRANVVRKDSILGAHAIIGIEGGMTGTERRRIALSGRKARQAKAVA